MSSTSDDHNTKAKGNQGRSTYHIVSACDKDRHENKDLNEQEANHKEQREQAVPSELHSNAVRAQAAQSEKDEKCRCRRSDRLLPSAAAHTATEAVAENTVCSTIVRGLETATAAETTPHGVLSAHVPGGDAESFTDDTVMLEAVRWTENETRQRRVLSQWCLDPEQTADAGGEDVFRDETMSNDRQLPGNQWLHEPGTSKWGVIEGHATPAADFDHPNHIETSGMWLQAVVHETSENWETFLPRNLKIS